MNLGPNKKMWGDTVSVKGEVSRIFVGNIDPKAFECIDLERRFEKYGTIQGVDINNNGFGFVQFERVEDAQRAVLGENQKILKNRTLELKMFSKSKKKRDRSRSPMGNRKNFKNQRNFDNNRRFFNQQRDFAGDNSDSQNNQQLVGLDPSVASNLNHIYNNNSLMSGIATGNQLQTNQMSANQLQANQLQAANQMQANQLLNSGNLNAMSQQPLSLINQSEFNRPPSTSQLNAAQPPSSSLSTNNNANELEIIVTNREQWPYCEMLEKRFRQETCLKFIDLVFPHSPSMINVTLRDLYEKGTLYAVVVSDALNEQNGSFTLHILHNQTEYSNISISDGISLICQDFIKEIANPSSSYYSQKQSDLAKKAAGQQMDAFNSQFKSLGAGGGGGPSPAEKFFNNQQQPTAGRPSPGLLLQQELSSGKFGDKKLPNNIAYVLKTTLEDNSAEFLSITQIDSVIEFYSMEKSKLLSRGGSMKQSDFSSAGSMLSSKYPDGLGGLASNMASSMVNSKLNSNPNNNLGGNQRDLMRDLDIDARHQQQLNSTASSSVVDSSQLLDNPQVKAALNSLIQMGALNTSNENQLTGQMSNNPMANQMNSSAGDLAANSYTSSYANSMADKQAVQLMGGYGARNEMSGLSHYISNLQSQGNAMDSPNYNKTRPNFYNNSKQETFFRSTKNDFNRPPRQSRFN